MDQGGFALPVLPGKADEARAALREAEHILRGERAASRRRIGMDPEAWSPRQAPWGTRPLGGPAGRSLGDALARFAAATGVCIAAAMRAYSSAAQDRALLG